MTAREPVDRGGGSSGAARPERRPEGRSEVLEAEAFRRRLGDEVRRALEADVPLSLVAIGVSLTPEAQGGPTPRGRGRLLEELGELLRAAVRYTEVVGRLAETRFGWILPATDDLSAWHAAERVRELVARTTGADGAVAISCGVCELAKAGSDADLIAARRRRAALGPAPGHGHHLPLLARGRAAPRPRARGGRHGGLNPAGPGRGPPRNRRRLI